MGKKEKKPSATKKSSRKQTRKKLILWIGLTLFVCVWMFILGILVGREMVPVRFDIQKLQNELAALKETVIKKELDQYKIDSNTDENKTKLGFYETLKKTGNDEKLKNSTIKLQEKPEPKKTVSMKKKKRPTQKKAFLQKKKKPLKKTGLTLTAKISDSKKVAQNNPPVVAKHRQAGNKFTIQVASLKDSKLADKTVNQLKKKGYPAYRIIGKIPGKGIWYRVRVGNFSSKAEAGLILKRLKKEKIDAIIVQR
jgi:cell division septation protein DedD